MRKMKDSCVEWIGEIPQKWVLKKIKNAAEYISSGTTPASNNLDYYDGNIYWIQSGDIYGKTVIADTAVKVTELALKIPSLTFYIAPYIVMAMYGGSIGNTAISLIDACTNQACCCVKNNTENNLHFMYYWLDMCKDIFLFQAEGGGQPNISQTKIKNQYYVQPPLSEQEKIATYLDGKCSEIDALTADIKKQIETLEEYKRSVITEAVTKGLDPDVEMKDSGVEWIGDIPEKWRVSKIKFETKQRNEKEFFAAEKDKYIGLENVVAYSNKLLETNTEYEDSLQNVCYINDVMFNKLRPYLCKVIISEQKAFCTGEFIIFKSFSGDRRFLRYFMLNQGFIEIVNSSTFGAKMPRADPTFIINMPILIPPPQEQQAISNYLDRKCDEIDGIIKEKQQQLETLAEYKKSLIYEYVTGKKEVI